MGRNSKRTLLGTIALVMLFALTAYAADITFRFHIADEGVGYNSTAAHKEAYPQFPSSATLNYIFKGNYYAWKSMNVMLRANATGTNAGFTVTGRWNPNAGTAYSGQ